ncbi:hypothetical protein ABZ805_17610 [Saccharopolyspora sp. NPDC047091]|uniref:hypothetical protein n=1 Tax=Saccharopolyspora sp. NPDC047091 TaxID=3155924 RepID=UPI0033D0FA90
MVNRLSLIDPALLERIEAVGPDVQRTLARAVALAAIEHTRLDDERLTPVIEQLRAPADEAPDLATASAAVDDLDNAAFDAQDRFDSGLGTEEDYVRAFTRARAASAALAAFGDSSAEAASDALYEAYHAADENMAVLSSAIESAL